MSMNWLVFWKVMFIAVMVIFALMSVLVTVLGARDIKRLIAGLKNPDDANPSSENPPPTVDGSGDE